MGFGLLVDRGWLGGGHCTNNTRPGTPCNLHNQLQLRLHGFILRALLFSQKKQICSILSFLRPLLRPQ
jgi:hypothetical protein